MEKTTAGVSGGSRMRGVKGEAAEVRMDVRDGGDALEDEVTHVVVGDLKGERGEVTFCAKWFSYN